MKKTSAASAYPSEADPRTRTLDEFRVRGLCLDESLASFLQGLHGPVIDSEGKEVQIQSLLDQEHERQAQILRSYRARQA